MTNKRNPLFTSPVESVIKKKFNVLDTINLAEYNHSNPHGLYKRLKSQTNPRYESTDRFVFLHFDSDYYVDPTMHRLPGLTITLLQKILVSLDIPNYFTLLVTNHENIEVELDYAYKMYSNDDTPISYIYSNLYRLHTDPKAPINTKLNDNLIIKKYSCLNGRVTPHREKLISLLIHDNLIDQGLVSYDQFNFKEDPNLLDITSNLLNDTLPTSFPREHLITYPIRTYENHYYNFNKITKITGPMLINPIKLDGKVNDIDTRYQFLELQKSFLYVATETVLNYPHSYLTEKSYKGITAKRPFIILGPTGVIKKLKNHGYKTFSDYWDESYDQIEDPIERILAIRKIINFICDQSIDKLQKMLIDMKDRLEFNFNHYLTIESGELDDFEHRLSKH